jgi:hypothetical protein
VRHDGGAMDLDININIICITFRMPLMSTGIPAGAKEVQQPAKALVVQTLLNVSTPAL